MSDPVPIGTDEYGYMFYRTPSGQVYRDRSGEYQRRLMRDYDKDIAVMHYDPRFKKRGRVFINSEDMTALIEAMQKVTRAFQKFSLAWNSETVLSGVEAKFQVRAGLDPHHAPPSELHHLVRSILKAQVPDAPYLRVMSSENRARVAAAAIRGWAASHG